MRLSLAAATILALPSLSFADTEVEIESFVNGKSHYEWTQQNDPVMGGRSTGSFSIDTKEGVGIFDGEVVNVPFLRAPGFIKVEGKGGDFPDVSTCLSLKLSLCSAYPYDGFRVSFGNAHVHGARFAFGYKATIHDLPVGEFGDVIIPFDEFTSFWDDTTGDPVKKCSDDKKFCPDGETLKNMKTISIWAEGKDGKVHLDIKSISAVGCEEGEEIMNGGSKEE